MTDSGLRIKLAETPDEIEAVHRLNYRTFAEEIGQHPGDGSGRLVDKFHAKNRYLVALDSDGVVGMAAVHCDPPFSVVDKLSDPSLLDTLEGPLLEVRLLAVEPGRRSGPVLAALIRAVHHFAVSHRCQQLLISGIVERQTLYNRLGFQALGPPIQSGNARYIPMILDLGSVSSRMQRFLRRAAEREVRNRS